MDEWIINRIKEIINGVSSLSDDGSHLLKGPDEFNTALYNGVITMMQNAVMPVAYVILGLLFLIELVNISVRNEGISNSGVEPVIKSLVKMAIIKMVIDSTLVVMAGIYEISDRIMNNIGSIFNTEAAQIVLDMAVVEGVIDDMDFATKLLTAIQVLLIWLIYKFAYLIMLIIITGRMVEIYIFLAISPLPLATLPNTETSGIAKNFLKSFAAVTLQGVMIFLVLTMYGSLVNSIGATTNYTDFTDALFQATLYSFVLVVSLFLTGKWSKSIMNAA